MEFQGEQSMQCSGDREAKNDMSNIVQEDSVTRQVFFTVSAADTHIWTPQLGHEASIHLVSFHTANAATGRQVGACSSYGTLPQRGHHLVVQLFVTGPLEFDAS